MNPTVTDQRRQSRSRLRLWRRWLLALHVALSVSWLGAAMVVLTLAVTARTTQASGEALSAYWAMHLIAVTLEGPLSVSVLLTGILVAVISPWGLLRYWWVVVSLIVTCVAVLLSLFALPAITGAAYDAATRHDITAELSAGNSLLVAGSVSTGLYLSLTVINVLKPWGRTAHGRHA